MKLEVKASHEGGLMVEVDRRKGFLDRRYKGPHRPRPGEWWEIKIVGENPRRTVFFWEPVRRALSPEEEIRAHLRELEREAKEVLTWLEAQEGLPVELVEEIRSLVERWSKAWSVPVGRMTKTAHDRVERYWQQQRDRRAAAEMWPRAAALVEQVRARLAEVQVPPAPEHPGEYPEYAGPWRPHWAFVHPWQGPGGYLRVWYDLRDEVLVGRFARLIQCSVSHTVTDVDGTVLWTFSTPASGIDLTDDEAVRWAEVDEVVLRARREYRDETAAFLTHYWLYELEVEEWERRRAALEAWRERWLPFEVARSRLRRLWRAEDGRIMTVGRDGYPVEAASEDVEMFIAALEETLRGLG